MSDRTLLRKFYHSKIIHRTWTRRLRFFRHYIKVPVSVVVRRKHEFNPELKVALRPWKLDPKRVRVVFIFGGGPYLERRKNHGLALSSPSFLEHRNKFPTLAHLLHEMCHSLGYTKPKHCSLAAWHDRGVMLINHVLTNNTRHAHAHTNIGWEYLVYDTVRYLSLYEKRIAFVFFGKPTWYLSRLVDEKKHLVLRAPYPNSQQNFYGCNIFPTVLEYIREDRDFFRLPTQRQTKVTRKKRK